MRWLWCASLVMLAGCGPSGPKTFEVSGTVTWEGNPVPEGDIVFLPVDGKVSPDAGKIHDGRFQFRAKAGKKRVEIHASRDNGVVDPVMKTTGREPYIPQEYNAKSILEVEVEDKGLNHFTFHLPRKQDG
jgi:hypothetical protein